MLYVNLLLLFISFQIVPNPTVNLVISHKYSKEEMKVEEEIIGGDSVVDGFLYSSFFLFWEML